MNITKKRLHKIKKTRNQSKRYIHKKSNKKNKKNKVSKGKKRAHNLKNKTLKLKHGKGKRNARKHNGDGKGKGKRITTQIGGEKEELWTPSSEEEAVEVSDIDVNVTPDKELWTPSSEEKIEKGEIDKEEVKAQDEEEEEEGKIDDKEESSKDEDLESKKGEKIEKLEDKEEEEPKSQDEAAKTESEKKEAEKLILLANLSNKEDIWAPFINALLKTVCVIEDKEMEKEEGEKEEDGEKEEEKEEDEEKEEESSDIDNEMFDKFMNYYGEHDQRRNDDLYTNAKAYFDIMKGDDDVDCETIDYKSGYESLEDMKDDDTYDEKSKLIVAIHNQVILEKDNIVEKIIKEKKGEKEAEEKKEEVEEEKKEEEGEKKEQQSVQTGGAIKDLKWFEGFKDEMKKAKYEMEEKVFIPKTNVILKLDFSNEKQLANPDITTQFIKEGKPVSDTVGDIMQEIVYSLTDHLKEAKTVKEKKEKKGEKGEKEGESKEEESKED